MGVHHCQQYGILLLHQSAVTFISDQTELDGVYRSGFASSQEAYEEAVIPLFDSLDRIEKILTGRDYLVGDQLTEADVRLFVTIVSTRPLHMNE